MRKPLYLHVLRRKLEAGEITSRDLILDCLRRIEKDAETVNAFLTVDAEGALAKAEASDERRKKSQPLSPWDGIPFGVKDNICVKGLRTTCSSKFLEDYIPPYTATVVERLEEKGLILLGKLNMDEFAMGSFTQNSALGVTGNPHDPTRVAGGSSGGSAAAVAAGEIPFSLGSDTGGSVRQPAALCGILGMKPTYGVLSRYGLVSYVSSMDCVGVLGNCAKDIGEVLSLMAGRDARDATSVEHPTRAFVTQPRPTRKGLRVGFSLDGEIDGILSSHLREAMEATAERLRSLGATVENVTLPSPQKALRAYSILSAAEAASNLARYDGVRFGRGSEGETPSEAISLARGRGLGREVKLRILLGTAVLTGEARASYYLPACRQRERITQDFADLFREYDLILSPTTPKGAIQQTERSSSLESRDMDLCTVYAGLTGMPSVSLPIGSDENGMPLGALLTAAHYQEPLLLSVAEALNTAREGGADA